jgi:predicted RNase H-like nuclease
MIFIGVDLGWVNGATGLASLGERLLNAGFRKYGLGVSSGESWTAFCGEDNRVLAGLRDLWLPAQQR